MTEKISPSLMEKQVKSNHRITCKKSLSRLSSQKAIMDAAKAIFAQKGYNGTTTKEIAITAGCAEGLIFKYFKDKQNLFSALIDQWFESSIEQLKKLKQYPNSLEDELTEIINWFFEIYQHNPELNKIALSQRFIDDQPPEILNHRSMYIHEREKYIIERMAYHQQQNHIAKNVDLKQIHGIIQSYALTQIILRGITPKDAKTKARQLVNLLMHGIQN